MGRNVPQTAAPSGAGVASLQLVLALGPQCRIGENSAGAPLLEHLDRVTRREVHAAVSQLIIKNGNVA
jgi:hypothetical protein